MRRPHPVTGAARLDVHQTRGPLDAGLPTRIIKLVLPCLDKPRTLYFPDVTPEMIATLERERDRMADRARCLTRNHDALTEYLEAVLDYGRTDPDPRADGGS